MKNALNFGAKKIAFIAALMAMTVALSSFGIPVPGGHLYLCDTVICLAALILDPLSAFIVGGFGSFLGDFFFYPAPMFVSLVTHGVQAVAVSLVAFVARRKGLPFLEIVALVVGSAIMVAGYTFGRAFVYATIETSIIKLPFEVLQAAFGAVTGYLLYKILRKRKVFMGLAFGERAVSDDDVDKDGEN